MYVGGRRGFLFAHRACDFVVGAGQRLGDCGVVYPAACVGSALLYGDYGLYVGRTPRLLV